MIPAFLFDLSNIVAHFLNAFNASPFCTKHLFSGLFLFAAHYPKILCIFFQKIRILSLQPMLKKSIM